MGRVVGGFVYWGVVEAMGEIRLWGRLLLSFSELLRGPFFRSMEAVHLVGDDCSYRMKRRWRTSRTSICEKDNHDDLVDKNQ